MLKKSVVKLLRKMASKSVKEKCCVDVDVEDIIFNEIDEGKHGIHILGTIQVHKFELDLMPSDYLLLYFSPLSDLHPKLKSLSKPPYSLIPDMPITIDLHIESKTAEAYAHALNVEEENLLDTIYDLLSGSKTSNTPV